MKIENNCDFLITSKTNFLSDSFKNGRSAAAMCACLLWKQFLTMAVKSNSCAIGHEYRRQIASMQLSTCSGFGFISISPNGSEIINCHPVL